MLPIGDWGEIILGLLGKVIFVMEVFPIVRHAAIDLFILALTACVVASPDVIIRPNILLLFARWVNLYGSGNRLGISDVPANVFLR